MTTATSSSVVDQSSDAGFRAWGSEFSTKLSAVGLVQTSDTGQINWTTVTRAAANASAGYEIWRFADSTLYMKFEYGSGSVNTYPQMWATVGTGSNGSGTITGQTSTRAIFTIGIVPGSTTTTSTSRWCHVADAFSVCWKEAYGGVATYIGGLLVVGKTVDGTGAATSTGFGVLRLAAASGTYPVSFQSVRTASTAQTFTDTGRFSCVAGEVSGSPVGGVYQAYDIWMNVPQVIPFNWANVIIVAEAGRGTSFSVAQVGTTPHTYASTGNPYNSLGIWNYTAGVYGIGYIYE